MKRGSFDLGLEFPVWIVRISILIIALVVIISGIYVHVSRNIEVNNFESQILTYHLLSCLSYGEERENLGTIDMKELPNLGGCIDSKDAFVRLSLETVNGENSTYYINPPEFDSKWGLCNIDIKNKNFRCNTIKHYVLIDGNLPAFASFNIILEDFRG